jgi:hypothetical protein
MPVPQVDTPTARALEDGGTVQFGIEGPSVLTAVAHVNPGRGGSREPSQSGR